MAIQNYVISICTISFMLFSFAADAARESFPTTGTITNPIKADGADPWVTRHNDHYYYCFSFRSGIFVEELDRLQDIGRGKRTMVWKPGPGDEAHAHGVWAPELHFLEGRWYIYFTADDGKNENHRMYALESRTPDPRGEYTFKGKVSDSSDKWAIDGTVLRMRDGRLYFIWSGWEGLENVQQNIYIAPMSNPSTINGPRVLLSRPEHEWEKEGIPLVNEAPQVLQHEGRVFLTYSASGSWTDHYCIGMLTLEGDDPLKPEAWTKSRGPVFQGTDNVTSPGHASFTTSPDGSEHWIVYHNAKHKGAGWKRELSIQPFTWNPDGTPFFGKPLSRGIRMLPPSGL